MATVSLCHFTKWACHETQEMGLKNHVLILRYDSEKVLIFALFWCVAERRRPEAASVTAGAVRCSAWLVPSVVGEGGENVRLINEVESVVIALVLIRNSVRLLLND